MAHTGESQTFGRLRADVVINAIAASQHGIVSRMQLVKAGVPSHVVDHRVKLGLLRPIHAGVYRVGPVASPRAREMAAVLACGRGGVVSHRSAAALRTWQAPQPADETVDVTVTDGRHPGRRPGIRVHRSVLAEDEITLVDSVPVTSPARTLLDLGTVGDARELERTFAAAERVDPGVREQLLALLARYPARRGTRRLHDLLGSAPALTRSEAEERLLALIRSGGLPEPRTNVRLHGCEVDFYWRRARLVVEVDGFAYHASSRAFLRDRQRDSALAALGIQVLRLAWHQIDRERDRTLVQLAQALAQPR